MFVEDFTVPVCERKENGELRENRERLERKESARGPIAIFKT